MLKSPALLVYTFACATTSGDAGCISLWLNFCNTNLDGWEMRRAGSRSLMRVYTHEHQSLHYGIIMSGFVHEIKPYSSLTNEINE